MGRGPDRRRQPRGGRRPEDIDGFSPLVLLVGGGSHVAEGAEAILARLKFAVATSPTLDEALRILPDLRPELIVAGESDAEAIRAAVRVPVVLAAAPEDSPERLTERILQALRGRPGPPWPAGVGG
jgi:ADP-heptose:LPS heptosyltransferase